MDICFLWHDVPVFYENVYDFEDYSLRVLILDDSKYIGTEIKV